MRSVRDILCCSSLLVASLVLTSCGAGGAGGGGNGAVAPSITTQPTSQTVTVGQAATFTVVATGTAPLTYQWQKNSAAISGATSASYTTPVTRAADNGAQFTVTVSNAAGSLTSSPATLTVNVPVSITTQPSGGIYFVGESATFSVTVLGANPTFQWTKNGTPIPGATALLYTTPPLASTDDNSSFAVIVSNSSYNVTSSSASIRVGPFATTYTTEQGAKLTLYVWPGQKMAILTASNAMDVPTMRKYLTAADGTFNYYAGAVGQDPSLNFNYNGLATIAEVQSTCGAGCTYIGATGMEIEDPYFLWMIYAIPNDAYDQIPFYEMGRSFWLFPQLQFASPDNNSCFVTGFAVLMRYRSISAQGYQGSFNSFATGPGDTAAAKAGIANYDSLVANTSGLIDEYAANAALNWSNTFLTNTYSGTGGLGCTDLFASLVQRLAAGYGGEAFIQDLWKEVLKRPVPSDTQTAVDNFILAASAAATRNLSKTFMNTWRWPMSAAAQTEAQNRWGNPI